MATNVTFILKLDSSGAIASVGEVTKSFTELDTIQQKFAKNAGKIAPKELDKYINDLKKIKEILGTMKPSFDLGKMAAQTTAQITKASKLLEQRLQQIQTKQVAQMQSGFGLFTRIESTLASRTPTQRKADTTAAQSDYKNKLEAENKALKEQTKISAESSARRKKDEQELANFILKQEEELLAKMRGRWKDFENQQKQFENEELNRVAKLATDELSVKEAALTAYNQALATNANTMKALFLENTSIHKAALKDNEDWEKSKIAELLSAHKNYQNKLREDEKARLQQSQADNEAWAAKIKANWDRIAADQKRMSEGNVSAQAKPIIPYVPPTKDWEILQNLLKLAKQALDLVNASFREYIKNVKEAREGASKLEKDNLSMVNTIKDEIANRNRLKTELASINPLLQQAATLRKRELELISDIARANSEFSSKIQAATSVQQIQSIINQWKVYIQTQKDALKTTVEQGDAAVRAYAQQLKALERLQTKGSSWVAGKQVSWSRTGQLTQMKASGASTEDIGLQKIKFKLEDIDKAYDKLVAKFQSKLLDPKLDQAGLAKLRQGFLTAEESLNKQRTAQQQLAGDLTKTNTKLEEQTRHHDSLIVRAVKLVSVYTLLNSVRQRMLQGLESVPATGMELESTHAVFKAIFVTQKDIEEQFVFLDNLADRTGARLLSLQESFRDFAASAKFSGESMSNIHQIFNDITEAGTVLHLPADKMKSALVAINQMYAKGQVMMEELKRQLGNQLPAAVAVFARSLNLSTSQLMDKMKKGLIKPEDSVAGFAAMYKQIFASNDAFAIASQGINASIGRLDNEWTRLAQGIYKSTSTYMIGALKGFANSLQFVRENLGLIATVAGVASVAIGIHLAEAFRVYAVAAQTAAFATAGVTTAVTSLSAVGAKLASIGAVALRWAGWVGAVVAVGTAIYKVGEATVSVNGESVKLFDILKTGWDEATKGITSYQEAVAKGASYRKESPKVDFVMSGIEAIGNYTDKTIGAAIIGVAGGLQAFNDVHDNVFGGVFKGVKDGWNSGFSSLAQQGMTASMEALTSKIVESAAGQLTAEQQKAKSLKKAEQDKIDEAYAASRKVLFEGTGEGMASEANQAMLSKNLELQTKISQSAIARIGNAVQMELKTLEVVKTGLDKKFARNEIAIIDYYNQQIDLLEKKYEIEHRGDVAKLELMQQEEARRRGFEENLVSMDAQTKELDKQKDILASINDAQTKGGDKPLILTFKTAEEERNQGRLSAPIIEANRKAFREAQLSKELESYKQAHNGSMLGYTQSVDTLANVPLTTNTEAIIANTAKTEELQKAYNEQTKKVVQTNLAIQERGQYSANVESDINNLVSSTLGKLTKGVDQWDTLIVEKAAKANIPANFLKALVKAESDGNPTANSGEAQGLVQFTPATGQRYGMASLADRNNPDKNLEGSAKYVSDIAKSLGIDIWKATEFQVRQIVAGYNSGEGSSKVGSKGYQHRQDLLAGKFYKESAGEGDVVVKAMTQMGSIPLPETKGAGAVSKAITGQLISNNAMEEQKLAIQQKQLTTQLEIQVLEDTRKAVYLDFVENLQKTTLEFKAQEGTISELERTNLIDLGTAKQKRQLTTEEAKAKLVILDTSGRITEEEKRAAQIALELIPLAKQQLDIDKQRVALKERISNEEDNIKAQQGLEQAKAANLPMAQAAGYGVSGRFVGSMVAQESARAQSDTFGRLREQAEERLKIPNQTPAAIDQINTEIQSLTKSMRELEAAKNAVFNQALNETVDSISEHFLAWANGAETVKESFRGIAIDFAKMIQEMIMNELKMMAVKGIMSMITGGMSGGGSVGAGVSNVMSSGASSFMSGAGFAGGGEIRGTGTGTSDSIPKVIPIGSYVLNAKASAKAKKNRLINLSHGEVVISPEQVAQLGLDNLNTMNTQGYATGGLVGGIATSSSTKPTGKNSNVYNINVAVPEGTSNPQQFGKDTGVEIYKAIAREEAKKELNRYNKMKTGGR